MSVYDPMLDYTVCKLKNGIKELQRLDRYGDYAAYAPRIASSMSCDIKAYLDYLTELLHK